MEANRKNALRSTGPKTELGKKRVRLNALRHGFFCKEVVIEKGDGREDIGEFNRLRESLLADLQPEGAREELIADLIVTHSWRLRRVFRYETGALHLRLDTAGLDQETQRADNLQWDLAMLPDDESRKKLRQSSDGIRFLIRLLGSVHEELKNNGIVTDMIHKALVKYFGQSEGSIGGMCSSFVHRVTSDHMLAESEPEPPEGSSEPDEAKQLLLDALIGGMQTLSLDLEAALDREQLRSDAHIAILNLPPEELANRISRHGTTIERQLYQAMAEFRRLQQERQGK
jgi:hypothetical protein